MKAIVHSRYGSPLDLEYSEVPTPEPVDNEVLVKIKYASLNASDFEIVRGDFFVKLANGLRSPKNWRLGCDFSGIVTKTGSEVSQFQEGDEVYADLMYQKPAYGAFAEFTVVPEARLRHKSKELSFEAAATIPQAGTLAVQGIREHMDTEASNKVLINGAGGGVGSYALQIAKYLGAEVSVVDHPSKFELLQDLGADDCYDYTTQDFTKLGQSYDLVLDVVARRGVRAHRRALKKDGRYRMVGGTTFRILQNGLFGALVSKFSSKKVGLLFGRPNDLEDMQFLSDLIVKNEVVPVIDRICPLEQTGEAIQYLMDGKVLGKALIKMT